MQPHRRTGSAHRRPQRLLQVSTSWKPPFFIQWRVSPSTDPGPYLLFASPPFFIKHSMPHLRVAYDSHFDLTRLYRGQRTKPIAQRMVFAYTVRVMGRKTGLARIIHEGSSPFDLLRVPSPVKGRKRADAKRDGHSEACSPEAYSCTMSTGRTTRLPVTGAY